MNIIKQIIFLILPIFLSGCAGFGVGTFGTHENFHSKFELKPERNKTAYFGSKQYTKEQIIALWGEPDKTGVRDGYNFITYYNVYNWSGVGAFVVILPIPLIAPSGHKEQTFYFEGSRAVGFVTEYGEVISAFGFFCGSNECKFIAGRAGNGIVKGELNLKEKISQQIK